MRNQPPCVTWAEKLALRREDLSLADREAVDAHVQTCPACEAAQADYHFLDSRLRARVREAAEAKPEGLLERLYAFLTFSTGFQMRSAMAGALMLVLLIGGGSFAGFEYANRSQPQASPTVNDLKILDNNAQALQQMDQLLDPNTNDDSGDPPTT